MEIMSVLYKKSKKKDKISLQIKLSIITIAFIAYLLSNDIYTFFTFFSDASSFYSALIVSLYVSSILLLFPLILVKILPYKQPYSTVFVGQNLPNYTVREQQDYLTTFIDDFFYPRIQHTTNMPRSFLPLNWLQMESRIADASNNELPRPEQASSTTHEDFVFATQLTKSSFNYKDSKSNISNTELYKLEQERFRLQQFSVEHAPDYVFWLDKHGQIIYANETACRELRYTAVEISMLKAQHLTDNTDAEGWTKLWSLTKEYGSCVFEIDLITSDTLLIPVEVVANNVSLDGKEYICAYVRNISNRKEEEAQLQQYACELERKNLALEELTYVTSHNLQEPLRAISSFAQLLSRRYEAQLDEQADEFINFITSGVQQMQSLLRDLSRYAQLNESKEPFTIVSMQKTVEHCIKSLGACLTKHQAKITVDALPAVRGRKKEIILLINHLLSNALKYRGDKLPEIHIGVEKEKDYWRFYIKDNGIGISPEYIGKIFDIFKRLHGYGSSKKGTGIGLAICQKITGNHGGEIWAEPNIKQTGTTFYFTLPAAYDCNY